MAWWLMTTQKCSRTSKWEILLPEIEKEVKSVNDISLLIETEAALCGVMSMMCRIKMACPMKYDVETYHIL